MFRQFSYLPPPPPSPLQRISTELVFAALGDLGGQDSAPYTTDIQRRVSDSLTNVALEQRVA